MVRAINKNISLMTLTTKKKNRFQIICSNFLLLAKLTQGKVVYCTTSSKANVSETRQIIFFFANDLVQLLMTCAPISVVPIPQLKVDYFVNFPL